MGAHSTSYRGLIYMGLGAPHLLKIRTFKESQVGHPRSLLVASKNLGLRSDVAHVTDLMTLWSRTV